MAELQHLMVPKSPATVIQSDSAALDTNNQATTQYLAQMEENLVISPETLTASRLNVYAAVLVNLATIIFMIVIVVVGIYIKRPGTLPTRERALYTLGTTIIASSIASFTSNQIRILWLAKIVKPDAIGSKIKDRNILRANLLLGLGKWDQQFRFWPISATLMISGLITAALVASVTPSISSVHAQSYTTLFFDQPSCFITGSSPQNNWYSWKLDNGSFLSLNASNTDCVTNNIDFSTALNSRLGQYSNGYLYAYEVGGVAVANSAIGTPFSTDSYFDVSFGNFLVLSGVSPLFQSATACFPILASNPVTCRRAGTVTVGSNEVTVEAGGCKIAAQVYSVDPQTEGAGVAGVCTDGHAIGQATIVLGAVNSWAESLAQEMGVSAAAASSIASFSVLCTVDIAPSISSALVTYSKSPLAKTDGRRQFSIGGSFTVAATGKPCTLQEVTIDSDEAPRTIPPSSVVTDRTLAIGAAAHKQLLTENSYRDGTWPTLAPFEPYFAFNNSQNPLEDRLGLVSAMVMGAYWGTPTDDGEGRYVGRGEVYNEGLRVGPGRWWALVYIVPELYAVVVILYFYLRNGEHR